MPEDALNARRMNVKGENISLLSVFWNFLTDGGKQPFMRPGWFRRGSLRGKFIQHMVYQVFIHQSIHFIKIILQICLNKLLDIFHTCCIVACTVTCRMVRRKEWLKAWGQLLEKDLGRRLWKVIIFCWCITFFVQCDLVENFRQKAGRAHRHPRGRRRFPRQLNFAWGESSCDGGTCGFSA